MDIDVFLTGIEHGARLHGRRESLRAVSGVLGALADVLPPRASELLEPHLPSEIRTGLAGRARIETPASCRAFLDRITAILYVDQPDNAFLARVVLEHLNASLRVISPAAFAHLVAADLRPLLQAGRPPVARTQPAAGALVDRIQVPAAVPVLRKQLA
ncbi:hypothetical protein AMIS_26600 [Actinoplanes missouriensis 431]|uniref:Uncharacterized protein n=1 Tax=Actinoplanes missouriensis (strain ATCC 14538 / DSM 43046 / CBS 188.64 / JCM 3121 / NBRC 102363 / NCIMB 12654 / NRRL B-3342 / UNCC 431) TaxID=512565 RepID=I0H4E3_ACTM4|nr:DUF2267 domain-containing protein [Actinoplanes missouriensis]BAL87880.1 hypothetical protein AMIS_26600 [Actinoplanes missouriensis 431]